MYIMEAAVFNGTEVFKPESRRKNQIILPPSKFVMVKNGPFYRCVQIMQKIPDTVKQFSDIKLFKNKLRRIIIEKCYYTIDEFFKDQSLANMT